MATNSKDVLADDSNEPGEATLLEIKEMLIDIQISVASVISENQVIRKEIEELKNSVTFYGKEMKDLKASLKKTNDENKALKNSINALNIQT